MKKLLLVLVLMVSLCAFASAEELPLSSLNGKIIGVNAGHQKYANNKKEPIAPGSKKKKAKCTYGTGGKKTKANEYNVNLQIALKLRDTLVARGAIVVMSRESNNVNISNATRAKRFNAANADMAIHLHCDSAGSGVRGARIYAPSKYVKKSIRKESYKAAKLVLKHMRQRTGAKSRGAHKSAGFTSLNYAKQPTMLFEMGYLSNAKEEKKLVSSAYQQKIAEGIADGMERYFDSLQPGL